MESSINLFDIGGIQEGSKEVFETILKGDAIKIERIITLEPYEEPGDWYDQELDEWVVLLQGSAVIEFKSEKIIEIHSGASIFIPAHKIHRVRQSSVDIKCIWLAIHGNLK